jgi:hypothetical protein
MNDQKLLAGTGQRDLVGLAAIEVIAIRVLRGEPVNGDAAHLRSGHGRRDARREVVEEDAVIENAFPVVQELVAPPGKG